MSTSGVGCGESERRSAASWIGPSLGVEPLLQPLRRREERVEAQDEVAAEESLLAAAFRGELRRLVEGGKDPALDVRGERRVTEISHCAGDDPVRRIGIAQSDC